jgi:hypothetical protein
VPNRRIATHFQLSEASVRRHAQKHLPEKLAEASKAEEILQADRLLTEEQEDRQVIRDLFKKASTPEPKGTEKSFVLQCRREVRGSTELLFKATGAWRERLGLDVSGGLTTKVEQEEADSIRFIEERRRNLLQRSQHLHGMRKGKRSACSSVRALTRYRVATALKMITTKTAMKPVR